MNRTSSGQNETSFLKRWHRRLGLSSAAFVMILASTGFGLNHTTDWHFDRKHITSGALLSWYGIREPESLLSYSLGERLITGVGDGVYLDTEEVARCSGGLRGAVRLSTQGFMVIACDQELFVLTKTYHLLERLGAAQGVPSSIEKIGLRNAGEGESNLVVFANNRYYLADLDSLTWTVLNDTDSDDDRDNRRGLEAKFTWAEPIATPGELSFTLTRHFVGEGITIERLLLDIHSGRIIGRWGVFVVDIMAVLFVILAMTGITMWRRETSKPRV